VRPFFERLTPGQRLVESEVLATLDAAFVDALRKAGILRDMDGKVHEVSVPDLARALRALYDVEGRGLFTPTAVEIVPTLLGWMKDGDGEREVVFVPDTELCLLNVSIRKRPTLALVPTARWVTGNHRDKHAPGAMVVLEILEEVLVVQGARLARASALAPDAVSLDRATLPVPAPRPAPARPAPFTGLERWNQLRICLVNERTVRVDMPGRLQRCTYLDLGMAHPRSRERTRTFEMLVAFCDGHGQFQGKQFGAPDATKQLISRLGKELRVLFGLRESPFHPYRRDTGWKTRFDARVGVPNEDAYAPGMGDEDEEDGDEP